ncbi:hypothetical protein [Leeuwenhoekiella sp. CH_XMU1409-2]|uniref:hypothetical protein n=1 Tax=Leeuwenhoekiella sp. CH_XMU1409-2 TaxID=3107768 RepID=UPI00300ADE37
MINRIKLPNALLFLILCSLPFMQLGFTYYISVFFLLFLVSFLSAFSVKFFFGFNAKFLIFGSLFFFIKVFSLVVAEENFSYRDILLPLRELLCFIGIIVISLYLKQCVVDIKKVQVFFLLFLTTILVLVISQYIFFSRGIYVGLPIDFFVINEATLSGSEKALRFGTRYRPTSFYGEPSYTSWITLSILTIILFRNEFNKIFKLKVIFVCFGIVLISQAVSGVLAILVTTLAYFLYYSNSNILKKIRFLIAAGIVFTLSIYLSEELQSRIYAILSNEDVSSNIRFLEPYLILKDMVNNANFFGVSNYSELMSIIDNAGFGLIIQYGVISIFILILLLKFVKNKILWLYLILSLNFNGTFFRFDKVLVISLVVGMSYCILKSDEKQQKRKIVW